MRGAPIAKSIPSIGPGFTTRARGRIRPALDTNEAASRPADLKRSLQLSQVKLQVSAEGQADDLFGAHRLPLADRCPAVELARVDRAQEPERPSVVLFDRSGQL